MSAFPPEGAFLGLEPAFCDRRRSRFAVLPVPYEKTTTYRKGTARGPAAILEASEQVELYDERAEDEPHRAGITTLPPFEFPGPPEALAAALEKRVGEILDGKQIPVILGGEHSISLGPIRAAKSRFPSLGVLHFDAHGDLRDEYEGTRYGHGCVMRRVLEAKVPIVQVGVRSLSIEEAQATRRARPGAIEKPPSGEALTFYMHDLPAFGDGLAAAVLSALPDPVYLSFDLDAFDSSLMAATGTPEPGGLLWEPVLRILDSVARARRIVALDFVELLPTPGLHACEFLAARLAYRAIGSVVRGKRTP
ncbi:MAG TPA: agmatinase [Planctomycetota bacterium]|nr:agmatinase [Planctomycetota bacterium]